MKYGMLQWLFVYFLLCMGALSGQGGTLIVDEVPIVNSNVLPSPDATGDVRLITLYLPEEVFTNPGQRFPTIYYLPGLGGTNNSFTTGNKNIMDDLLREGQVTPMIIVHVDGSLPDGVGEDGLRHYLGGWYVNSTLNGNFEDFIVRDLIPYVDAHYPTIATQPFRAIMGQSMGGFGAVYHGIVHPELFAAFANASGTPFWVILTDTQLVAPDQPEPGKSMFVMNSLILTELPAAGPNAGKVTPDNGILSFSIFAYAGSFSPNINKPPYFVELPFEVNENNEPLFVEGDFFIADPFTGERIITGRSLIPRPEIIELWKQKDPYFLVEDHIETAKRQSIYHDGGNLELINAVGARVISDKMSDLGIDYEYILYNGGHETCLTSELCSRHRTMFQLISAKFAQNGQFPDDVRIKLVGNGSIILQDNAQLIIQDDVLVGIETSPELNITSTNIGIEMYDAARITIGTDTDTGGVLQIGNRFTKARLKGDPSLQDHHIQASIIVDGPQAVLEVGKEGVLGIGVGVDGKDGINLNLSSATTLTNLDLFTLDLQQGTIIHNQAVDGTQLSAALLLVGPSVRYVMNLNPNSFLLGGSDAVELEDSLWRHPVVLSQPGLNMPGGIRNNLDTNPNAIDYFFHAPMGSTTFYTNIIDDGTVTSLPQRDDFFTTVDPFTIDTGDVDAAYDFLAIDDFDDYLNSEFTSKEGALGFVDGQVVLTYVDNNKIITVPEAAIPIDMNQNINLRELAFNHGTVHVHIETINGQRVLLRVDDPDPA